MNRKKKAIVLTGVSVLFVLLLVVGGYLAQRGNKTVELITSKASAISSEPAQPRKPSTAVADMDQAINDDPGLQAAATLIDLDNDQEYDAGESSYVFQGASTAKIIASVDYMHEVEQGKASLNQDIDGTSAQQQLKQMIEVSDNNAWLDINEFLGSQQQSYAKSIGLSTFTGAGINTITSDDEAKLLQELYEGKLINSSHRSLLYSYMGHTNNTELIPAALPGDATVYNKYGQLDGELHDAAIVSYQGRHFVLIIFTKNPDENTQDYTEQITLIHNITEAAFNDVMAG